MQNDFTSDSGKRLCVTDSGGLRVATAGVGLLFNSRQAEPDAARRSKGGRLRMIAADENISGYSARCNWDLIVVGSGAASVVAALRARRAGLRALIVEKTDLFGGSTALSGGIVWVPNNPVSLRAGVSDSFEAAANYLDGCAGAETVSSSALRRAAFLRRGPDAITFLECEGMRFFHSEGWSDYHVGELPGGLARGRAIEADIFALSRLRGWKDKLRRNTGVYDVPLTVPEIASIAIGPKTVKSAVTHVVAAWRMLQMKLGRHLVAKGAALQGRLLELALAAGIEIWLDSPVVELTENGGVITGAVVERSGEIIRLSANYGVLLDAGGYSHDHDMRRLHSRAPAYGQWSAANPGDTGEVMKLAIGLGAATDLLDEAIWIPSSFHSDGRIQFNNPLDTAKPHLIMVDGSGQRYVNEAASYVAVGIAMFERHKEVPAIPSWIVMDSQNRAKYRMGLAGRGRPPQDWIDSGYMKVADSLDELAAQCSIDPVTFSQTISRFNAMAILGVDEDFGRGQSAYNHFWGDPTMRPNPNLGEIAKPPFYAVQVVPGDVGTSGGLVTDEHARVLRSDGTPIPGLYAAGNVAASVMGRSYPGAGASIGSSLVFGFIAAEHMVMSSEQRGTE